MQPTSQNDDKYIIYNVNVEYGIIMYFDLAALQKVIQLSFKEKCRNASRGAGAVIMSIVSWCFLEVNFDGVLTGLVRYS